jgi:hypothetical protein
MNIDEKILLIKELPPNNKTRILKCRHRELYDEIEQLYPQLSGYPFKQKLYWYVNQLIDFPKCKRCNKPISSVISSIAHGYGNGYCSLKCSNNSSDVKQKKKNRCILQFGCENPYQSEKIKEKQRNTTLRKYGAKHISQTSYYKQKYRQTCLEKFGTEYALQAKEVKQKKMQTCLEKYGVEYALQVPELIKQRKQTCLEKYGVEYALQVPELIKQRKQTCLEKYGVENPSQLEHFKEKKYHTHKKNNSFSFSKPETIIYQILIAKYPNILRNYKSEKYPFNCDFYIPEIDTYIELHFTWCHGKEPYIGTPKQLDIINNWAKKSKEMNFKNKPKNFYKNAIYTWTFSDLKKLQWAKEHNLNWLCFYNIDQFNTWFNKI